MFFEGNNLPDSIYEIACVVENVGVGHPVLVICGVDTRRLLTRRLVGVWGDWLWFENGIHDSTPHEWRMNLTVVVFLFHIFEVFLGHRDHQSWKIGCIYVFNTPLSNIFIQFILILLSVRTIRLFQMLIIFEVFFGYSQLIIIHHESRQHLHRWICGFRSSWNQTKLNWTHLLLLHVCSFWGGGRDCCRCSSHPIPINKYLSEGVEICYLIPLREQVILRIFIIGSVDVWFVINVETARFFM